MYSSRHRAAAGLFLLVAASALVDGNTQLSRVKRIVGGKPAEEPPRIERESSTTTTVAPPTSTTTKEPLVFVRRDRRSAVVNGIQNPDGTYSFLGLRYAQPPIKGLRFQRPRRMKLKGVVNALQYGPPCPQWYNGRVIGSEDCLFLNIYTPEVPLGDGRPPPSHPVLIWIHGGNFKTGSAAQYLPRDIVRKGVVVVTLQYRLGSLGFLSLGRKELPGNVGLFDIAAAVHWVRDYIKFFGGNPNQIIVSGQGSGASCASFLAFNNVARNNIKGIFAMSGSPVSPFTLDENEVRTANDVAELDGCSGQKDVKFVRCMQNLPLETILKGDSGVEDKRKEKYDYSKELSNLLTPGPAEEGKEDSRFLPHFLPMSPYEAIKKGNFPNIPLMTGVTKDETGGGVKGNFLGELQKLLSPEFLQGGLFKDLLNANTGLYVNKAVNPSLSKLFDSSTYVQFFTNVVSTVVNQIDQVVQHTTDAFFNLPAFITSHLWSQKNKVFLYSFEHKGKSKASNFLQGIPLVPQQEPEGSSINHGDDLAYLFDIQSLEGKSMGNSSDMSEDDKKVRDVFTTMVAAFAKSGSPGGNWKSYTKEGGEYMKISRTPELLKGFRKCAMALWTGDTNILSSVECGMGAASKIVTDTLGPAGTQALQAAGAIEGKLGSAVSGVSSGFTNATKGVTGTLTNPAGALAGLGGGSKGGGGSGSLSGLLGGGGATTKKPAAGGGGLLGGGGTANKKPGSLGFGGLGGIGK